MNPMDHLYSRIAELEEENDQLEHACTILMADNQRLYAIIDAARTARFGEPPTQAIN